MKQQAQTRSMKELSLDERRQILLELDVEKARVVRERHNVSNQVISHLRWYYGKVNHGGFHRDIVGNEEHPLVERIRGLKREEMTSAQAASTLGLDLSIVNRVWGRV